ncbi:hypothetical protein, partial [Haloferula sp. A504]|uniref:hypothetical protein n=1 Tax=Haloferula sp. A504 TaxID=3373601 RepID=UPI0031C10689|nr:hypothetical protein [Verrucomicrobiaceae bacterium E54]
EGLGGEGITQTSDAGLKPAASGGKYVRRKVGQDGLLLHNYNYRNSTGFPSFLYPKTGLIPCHSGPTLNTDSGNRRKEAGRSARNYHERS